jgi:hypothetical protein
MKFKTGLIVQEPKRERRRGLYVLRRSLGADKEVGAPIGGMRPQWKRKSRNLRLRLPPEYKDRGTAHRRAFAAAREIDYMCEVLYVLLPTVEFDS